MENESEILTWLNKEGYPLEMETASIAKDAGFEVSQSDYYIDPEDSGAREIDIVANNSNYDSGYTKSYNLFIECKSSKKGKPWIVFSNESELLKHSKSIDGHVLKMQRYSSLITNDHADGILSNAHIEDELANMYPKLGVEPMIGHGVTQAFSGGSDIPFKAMMSATKAAMSHVERFGKPFLSTPCVVAVPIVVIDSPLYCVSYDLAKKEFIISNISRAEILWKHLVAGKSRNAVFIVEKSSLKDFFADCKKASDWWMNIDNNDLLEITHNIKERSNQKP